ncbi:uncharacterized protein F4822DRAFT_120606 [Hypoxylon trugodes]|uniref:uncharacterized protein n=1 Tax=Hypoxylon trugodes TaxID=326681 RepID=UPI002190AE93|nr:uncharacterized protein F4822DRAFT_120606 [Hypoxylon trugodes]KAI1392232.1 hypothetical protein F4822DRAFT_120606 [Hypoxylon trugodes]
MTERRRPATRRTGSVEPASELVVRQTRSHTRRPEASAEPESHTHPQGTQRGTRRRRRKSPEGVAIDGFTNPPTSRASPGPGDLGLASIPEDLRSQNQAISETNDAHESSEMEAARVQDMLDFDIPKLRRWSDKMYDVLSSIDIHHPSVEEQSRLNGTRKAFDHAHFPFTANSGNNALFIKPIVLSEGHDSATRSTIQTAIYSGNIIILLSSIIDVQLRKKDPQPVLEQLDHVFPSLFGPYFQTGNDIEKTLDLSLRIRYRYLVESIAADSSAEPLEVAADIFCEQSLHHARSAQEALDKGPYKQLAGIKVNENFPYYEAYQACIQKLISNHSDRDKMLPFLDEEYPQIELSNDLRSWALEVYQQLRTSKDPDKLRAIDLTADLHTQTERGESESLFVDNNEVEESSDSSSEMDDGEYDRLTPQESNQNFIDSAAVLAAVRQSEKKVVDKPAEAPPSNQQAAKGKAKAVDTADAIRHLEPIQILSRMGKRPSPNTNDFNGDDEDHDDFEVNEQLHVESRRTRNDTITIQRPPSKRPRLSQQYRSSTSPLPSPPIADARRASRERLLDDLQEGPNLQEQDIVELSQSARNIRRANYATKVRQTRIPWSVPDTARLLDLIADPSLKCSWSAMEKAGGFETDRNQQSLRDKARGLKVWYLEGDRLLPAGFDQVALGQKEKAAVIKCGRNPDRREDDIDEEGQLTNNIWVD